jgi:hypothetical protein
VRRDSVHKALFADSLFFSVPGPQGQADLGQADLQDRGQDMAGPANSVAARILQAPLAPASRRVRGWVV